MQSTGTRTVALSTLSRICHCIEQDTPRRRRRGGTLATRDADARCSGIRRLITRAPSRLSGSMGRCAIDAARSRPSSVCLAGCGPAGPATPGSCARGWQRQLLAGSMCRATIRARIALRAAAVCLLSPWAAASSGAPLVDMDLFTAGDRGYTCFRLPNLISLKPAGHMLAIVQGHKFDCSDGGRMDILLRRTVDSGRTWAPAEFVYGESTAESNVTMGTPTAVVDLVGDEASGVVPGTVFLFICRNFKHVLLLTSTNGGISCE